ncbi:MAG: GTPase [Lachnospiraceae bacterium]|jgi:uncharacterized membrane protein YcgQ (UPF0703/DUF1980 family)|nr:GTPase [Lachnospiraceae bacterium]
MKPVYMINGFLESGKTEFIQYTLQQSYFQVAGRTLLLLCEEGELEYDQMLLERTNTVQEIISDVADFTSKNLLELEKKYKPVRIVIEFNGMWNSANVKLPWHWQIEQQVTIIDASSFVRSYTNMRSLLAQMIRGSEMIVFNRCDKSQDLASFRRNVKAINQKAEIIFEDENGQINEIFEEDLPYDLSDEPIVVGYDEFSMFYFDAIDHPKRYENKIIQLNAMVLKPQETGDDCFVAGWPAMTCCADDITFLGFVVHYESAQTLVEKHWITLTASFSIEYREEYGGEGPVMYAHNIRKSQEPSATILRFI